MLSSLFVSSTARRSSTLSTPRALQPIAHSQKIKNYVSDRNIQLDFLGKERLMALERLEIQKVNALKVSKYGWLIGAGCVTTLLGGMVFYPCMVSIVVPGAFGYLSCLASIGFEIEAKEKEKEIFVTYGTLCEALLEKK